MHPCEEYKALISALIDDEISDTDRVSLMAHLVECENCRLYWEDQITIHEAMADMSAAAPAGFADSVMARVRETKQEQPVRKVISFPRRFAGLAACCAVVLIGIFAANSGMLTMDIAATSNCAAPEAAYSMMSETQTAGIATDSAAECEESPAPPAATEGETRAQSEADNGSFASDSSAPYSTIMAYAARISTDSDIAAQWVEDTLGQVWQSGTSYLLTTEEYADLTTLLENSGEDFEILDGTGSGELYLLLAR